MAIVAEGSQQLLVEQSGFGVEWPDRVRPESLACVHEQVEAAQPQPLQHVDLHVVLLLQQHLRNYRDRPGLGVERKLDLRGDQRVDDPRTGDGPAEDAMPPDDLDHGRVTLQPLAQLEQVLVQFPGSQGYPGLPGPFPPRAAQIRSELILKLRTLVLRALEGLSEGSGEDRLPFRVGRVRLQVASDLDRNRRRLRDRRLRDPQPRLLARRGNDARRVRRNVPCPPPFLAVLGHVPDRLLTEAADRLKVLNQANGARAHGGIGLGHGRVNSSRLCLPASREEGGCDGTRW